MLGLVGFKKVRGAEDSEVCILSAFEVILEAARPVSTSDPKFLHLWLRPRCMTDFCSTRIEPVAADLPSAQHSCRHIRKTYLDDT
jgi:hypothetical protein